MQYKKISINIRDIGKELHVGTVLEGSVRRSGNQIRIVAQLIDANNEVQLWADTYDKELTQVFAIQSDVAQQIALALKAKLSSEEKKRIEQKPTQNVEAYTLYLQGRFFWNKRTEEGFKKAIEYFQQAIEKDPSYARAYAGIADCYNLLGVYGYLSPKESALKAKEAAEGAIKSDNALAESHEALAHVEMLYDWNWSDVEREYKEAITLDPDYATAHQRYAIYLTMRGQMDEALASIKRAQELDPLSLIINTDVGLVCYLKSEFLQATEQCQKAIALDSDFVVAYFIRGMIDEQLGKFGDAVDVFQKAVKLSPGNSIYLSGLGHAYASAGNHAGANKVLSELLEISKQRYVSPYSIACVYAGIGEKEKSLEWLQKACEDRSVWLIHLHMKVDPRLRNLQNDPRFVTLMRKMDLQK
jgi:tetratricopeptide (TPR) repeat protein